MAFTVNLALHFGPRAHARLVLAALLSHAARAHAQPRPGAASVPPGVRRPVGTPPTVRSGEALAEVRMYASVRTENTLRIAYIGTGRVRGRLLLATLQREPDGSLRRTGTDRELAPSASAVALTWDARGGAALYVTPTPHRNESERDRHARHHNGTRSMQDSLRNPLGTPSLTAGDVHFVRLDAQGAPAGRPLRLFSENARAFRVALVREGDGWLAGWTGAHALQGEVRGTVRFARITADARLQGATIESGFSGPQGDGLVLFSSQNASPARAAWSGEHCHTDPTPAPTAPARDPSESIETRPRFVIPQGPLHEIAGPRVVCDSLSLYTLALPLQAPAATLVSGPALARDTLTRAGETLLFSQREGHDRASLRQAQLAPDGRLVSVTTLVSPGPTTHEDAPARVIATAQPDDRNAPTDSTVPPPTPPQRAEILRAPVALDASSTGPRELSLAALSIARTRVIIAQSTSANAEISMRSVAPIESAHELTWVDPATQWLLLRVGDGLGGPLVHLVLDRTDAGPEVIWPGDERLRAHLLRARIARAAVTDLEHSFGPLSARSDAATNPSMVGLTNSMRRVRARWTDACDSLQARARFLVRRGLPRELETLARQQCEIPALGAAPTSQ
ncbi:MAG: hypothetical protein Q8Q09_00465 [Deltaproteobacteria bacterium]|nr:hypothetical protein [Deltaproteobacteria bacterium]